MLSTHPCFAWTCWLLAGGSACYVTWTTFTIPNWAKLLLITVGTGGIGVFGTKSVYARTELDFPFVHPGVFLVQSTGDWVLPVTGQNTHLPLFNVQLTVQDLATLRTMPLEPDISKRGAIVQRSDIQRDYPEIGPTFLGDRIFFHPADVNDQEYGIQARYRIGNDAYLAAWV
jgi:hypothetical protein